MNKMSLIEIAYNLLKKKKNPYDFYKLWEEVRQVAGLETEEAMTKMSGFYTQLILDGRFVTLGENKWDLRVRHTFDKVHIDMNDIYAEDEELLADEYDDDELSEDDEEDEDKEDEDDDLVDEEKAIDFISDDEEY